MRFFTTLAYRGTDYVGWQNQPNQVSVQSTLEDAFSTILNQEIAITGCGRTDTGVHAKHYVAHLDIQGALPENHLFRINKYLPKDIAIFDLYPVHATAHARFDAFSRGYEYHLTPQKDPFSTDLAFYHNLAKRIDLVALQEAASLLLDYQEFYPFCKSNTDVKTMICEMEESRWEQQGTHLVYHVRANRFLRGMVRLIVGMCLNVGLGKLSLETVREAMEKQERMQQSWSVPPQGLYLKDIRYPYIDQGGQYHHPV